MPAQPLHPNLRKTVWRMDLHVSARDHMESPCERCALRFENSIYVNLEQEAVAGLLDPDVCTRDRSVSFEDVLEVLWRTTTTPSACYDDIAGQAATLPQATGIDPPASLSHAGRGYP